jgi:hypothetical protein
MKEITESEFYLLERDSYLLCCLEEAGVDNWDGYHYAYRKFLKKYYPEEVDENEEDL